ncbi:hypothetical protein CEP54_015622 [Fusarium duplospermum]|uniref:Uncharacterized protein n=1 Tax=Fusarium duplospermum TaxID=1325734 RepID=A0A428NMP5_9HYPO|nr:hypothetical protein CEP54_015622 [Fusarium duplospermum]
MKRALDMVNTMVTKPAGKVDTRIVDVSKESDVQAAVNPLDAWGGANIMFNNGGIMHTKDGDAEEISTNIWDLTMDIYVKGMVAIMGAAMPQLAYATSKSAVLDLTRELAISHAREGRSCKTQHTIAYRFNSLCPALLNTPMLQEWLGPEQPKWYRQEVHFSSGRFGEAVE